MSDICFGGRNPLVRNISYIFFGTQHKEFICCNDDYSIDKLNDSQVPFDNVGEVYNYKRELLVTLKYSERRMMV